MFISGTFEAMPPGARLVKPKKIRVIFGKPLRFPDEVYKSRGGRETIMNALTEAMKSLESEAAR